MRIRPCRQIFNVVADATAMLAVFGTDATPAHIIECPLLQTQESRGFYGRFERTFIDVIIIRHL